MWSVARKAVAEGPVALWRGALPRVAYMAPLTAISFTVYEAVRSVLKETPMFRDAGAGGRSKPEAGIAGDRDALEDAGEDTGAQ